MSSRPGRLLLWSHPTAGCRLMSTRPNHRRILPAGLGIFSMSHAKQASKRKRRTQVVPILGVAGLSLSLASGASAIGRPAADIATRNTAASHQTALCEEEVSEVSLATFYIFDKENARTLMPRAQLAAGGGCGCGGCGCAGCAGCATGTVFGTSTLGSNINPPYYSITPAHKYARARRRVKTP